MFLVDIGNSRAHLYNGKEVFNLSYNELFDKYANEELYYINVNISLVDRLEKIANWINLEPYVNIPGEYNGMGVDRRVLLLSKEDGIYIDVGSALTIDKKLNGAFVGGTILPGIYSLINSYKGISKILDIEALENINLDILPKYSTKEAVSYGIIAPIILLIKEINLDNLPIYCCGGDAGILANYLNIDIKQDLIFIGMKKVIKEIKC